MQQARSQVKSLKIAVHSGDADAARMLLADSVALGHARLSLRRFLVARTLPASGLEGFRAHCQAAARHLTTNALPTIARNAVRHVRTAKGVDDMVAELLPPAAPLILPFDQVEPRFGSAPRHSGAGSCILGKVKIGSRALIGREVVVRADGHFVRIGDDFTIGDASTVHIAHDVYPTIVGDRVTVGRNAVIHACSVGDDCVIEDDVVVLDGSVVEDDVVIEAGATVFPRSTLKSGFIYAGSPAKPIGRLAAGECAARASRRQEAIAGSALAASKTAPADIEAPRAMVEDQDAIFIARNARLSGRVTLCRHSSVFFACVLEAGTSSIVVGERTNIQDNTRIRCNGDGVAIGADTTIGHNVHMQDCRIGRGSLIGIGSVLAGGTVVEDDVILAAGAVTDPGQRLEPGWIWGGRPARRLAKLDDGKRQMMHTTIEHYRAYAEAYRQAQERPERHGESDVARFKAGHASG